MLNVSPIKSGPNVDNRYQNITILSRPLTTQSTSGQPSNRQHNNNTKNARTGVQQVIVKQADTGLSQVCATVESPSVVSSPPASVSLSLGSLPSQSTDRTNGSQSLRSTVLANNTNNNNNNNNESINCNNSNNYPNIGDKSPMCRINEISRFNDIKHEYHLIDESGPPHNKTFIVVLKLGQIEEFRGSGPSIKKAQRNAATIALQQTKLKHPTPRLTRHNKDVWPMTPTVELNMLAMKLGQNAEYQVYDPITPRHQGPTFSFSPMATNGTASNAYDYRGMHYQRYHMPRGLFSASLTVGERQFIGKGHTAQAARHAAAEEALKVLRQVVQNSSDLAASANVSTDASVAIIREDTDCDSVDNSNGDRCIKSPISVVHEMALRRNLSVRFAVIDESGPSHMPKFVTQCTVGHIVTTGDGNGKKISKKNASIRMVDELNKLEPLVTSDRCDASSSANEQTVGHKRSQMANKKHFNKKKNQNFSKNIVKENITKRLGERNLDNDSFSNQINNSLEPIPDTNVNKNNTIASNDTTTIKDSQTQSQELTSSAIGANDMTDGGLIHPINRLIQLQQARKEKEPHFLFVSERVIDRRRREFTIECTIQVTKGPNAPQTVSSLGLGPNKKVAKKNAADQMLQLLGYSSRALPQSILKQDSTEGQSSQHKKIRQVKFIEDNNTSSLVDMNCGNHLPKLGRQLVPGLILMPSDISTNSGLKSGSNLDFDCNSNSKPNNNSESVSKRIESISSIAKEFLDSKLAICKIKCEDEDINGHSSPNSAISRSDQLKSLVQTVGTHQLQVHFSDFPRKQNNGQSMEYLSVVTITAVWNQAPIVSHGSGLSVDEARNQASHQALIQLSQLEGTHCS